MGAGAPRWRTSRAAIGETVSGKFVFVGAGGGAIELLQKSGIPEGHGYGGFPVHGIWLRCDVDEVSKRHHAKVYGKAAHGSPPMSVPHLDERIIGGKRSLLFGPYAGFSTKFLKHGSYTDLFRSIEVGNIIADAGSSARRLAIEPNIWLARCCKPAGNNSRRSRNSIPLAQRPEWREAVAGQRVQIIKPRDSGA